MQLLNELHGTDDGARHQLREEAQIEAEVQEIGHRGNLAPLDVHHVAHRLEGEEGDAHREDDGIHPENFRADEHVQPLAQDVVHLQMQAEEVVHKVREEVRVLEIGQDSQVDDYAQRRYGRPSPLGFEPMQPLGSEEVIDNYKKQQRQEHAAGLVVEEQRHGKEVAVTQQRLGVEQREDGEHQRKERPEVELGEQQRMGLVEGEQALEKVPYDVPKRHRR